MSFTLNITPAAQKGIEKIRKSGDRGKMKQVEKALTNLASDPAHPGLKSHRMKPDSRFDNRDDLWISYVRIGPVGERIVWAFGKHTDEVQIIDVEYVGRHLD
jgi:hypothetical protein